MKKTNSKILILTSMLLSTAALIGIMLSPTNTKKSVAILLTGTSTSGKTSTTNAIMKQYNDTYKIINIDDFCDDNNKDWTTIKKRLALEWGWNHGPVEEFVEKFLSLSENENCRKQFENAFDSGCAEYITNNSLTNKNIVIDTVVPSIYFNLSTILPERSVIKILLYCPLSTIGLRYEKRNATGNSEEYRNSWDAFLSFFNVYTFKENDTEATVDTLFDSQQLRQLIINGVEDVKKYYFSLYENSEQCEAFEKFYHNFLQKLETDKKVVITTRHSFDLIINTDIYSPTETAKMIVDCADTSHNAHLLQ